MALAFGEGTWPGAPASCQTIVAGLLPSIVNVLTDRGVAQFLIIKITVKVSPSEITLSIEDPT